MRLSPSPRTTYGDPSSQKPPAWSEKYILSPTTFAKIGLCYIRNNANICDMPDCNIRNIDESLMREMKAKAAQEGLTLRDWAISRFATGVGWQRDGRGNARTERLGVDLASAGSTRDAFHAGESGLVGDRDVLALEKPQCPECLTDLYENRKMRMWWCKCGHQQRMK